MDRIALVTMNKIAKICQANHIVLVIHWKLRISDSNIYNLK